MGPFSRTKPPISQEVVLTDGFDDVAELLQWVRYGHPGHAIRSAAAAFFVFCNEEQQRN
jgi:hypothetical protein